MLVLSWIFAPNKLVKCNFHITNVILDLNFKTRIYVELLDRIEKPESS